MSSTQRIVTDRVEMITSFLDSITKAGGRQHTWEEVRHLTLEQIVERYAQNGIRFVYQKR